ncbi:hypothetical protein U9M48_036814 [Paspalum notatum var. saurae]|uniref:Reverse transcriptase domain-containing protein n=1 Tax=Paspalum notatum var. saurae TaxID=547442 RepID=A0AAQ3X9X6_PASNO
MLLMSCDSNFSLCTQETEKSLQEPEHQRHIASPKNLSMFSAAALYQKHQTCVVAMPKHMPRSTGNIQKINNKLTTKPFTPITIPQDSLADHIDVLVGWLPQQHPLPSARRYTFAWKWTSNGIYSSKSAYRAQFLGSYSGHKSNLIWRARAENKCKVFAWILIKNKILTADNLAARGWPHQTSCTLCNGPMESALHLCLSCPYAQEVWNHVLAWENLSLPQQAEPRYATNLGEWWESAATLFPASRRRDFSGVVIYTMWNIWKERNRRIFENCSLPPLQVAGRISKCYELKRTKHYELDLGDSWQNGRKFDMKTVAAPGPNGFGVLFFQKFWDKIKGDMLRMFQDFYEGDLGIQRLNYGVITLVPKIKEAREIKQYRPICLLNMDFKIFTKVLTNRLTPWAGEKGFWFCMMVLHSLRKTGKRGLIMKIDFEKTYDKVSWSFLRGVMIKKGFPDNSIGWVMQTVQGGRGDPLSPLLFNLVADVLGVLMEKAVNKGYITGVLPEMVSGGISHMQYADDTIVMVDGSDSSILHLKLILYCFEWMSGLKINYHKSEVYAFGVNQEEKWRMANMLNWNLGIPVSDRHMGGNSFYFLLDKMNKRLDPWKGKQLSSGGKLEQGKQQMYEKYSVPDALVSEVLRNGVVEFQLNKLQVASVLCNKGWKGGPKCGICNRIETAEHRWSVLLKRKDQLLMEGVFAKMKSWLGDFATSDLLPYAAYLAATGAVRLRLAASCYLAAARMASARFGGASPIPVTSPRHRHSFRAEAAPLRSRRRLHAVGQRLAALAVSPPAAFLPRRSAAPHRFLFYGAQLQAGLI